MTTKTTKAAKATKTTSKKTTATLHIATAGKGTPICGAKGKGGTAETATCEACKKIAAHAEEKAKNEAKSKAPARSEAKLETGLVATPAPARPRDPRLPPAGTVLRKHDRHGQVRCECTVTATGVEYKGQEFRSISGAAMAAAKDLGVAGAQNGFVFWSLAWIPTPAQRPNPRRHPAPPAPVEAADDC